MVEVEIRTPVYDEEEGHITWRRRALVRAEGDDLVIYTDGDGVVLPEDLLVVDLATGARLRPADDPERWVRGLPHTYRNGDLVAVVLLDTDEPQTEAAVESSRTTPSIPVPPEPAGMLLST
jgi:hypothetical protein